MAQPKKQLEKRSANTTSSERTNRTPYLAELKPAEVAFLGEYEADTGSHSTVEKSLFVQVLCWSRTAQGWAALNDSWDSMKAYRSAPTPWARPAKAPPPPPSWVYAVTPQLGAPFRDNPAEESTLAAWISRAQVSFAAAIIDKSNKDNEGTHYRSSILDCLSGYQSFLALPGYEPCRLVMTAEYPQKKHARLMEAFKDSRLHLQTEAMFESLVVQSCSLGKYPLPLELANLASAAVVRYINAPTASNPIYDAVRIKLVQIPSPLAIVEGLKRR